MPKVLTKEQIEQYHDEGFISPVRVISENEALLIKNQLEQVEADFPDEINAQSRNNLHLSFAFLDALAHNTIIVDAKTGNTISKKQSIGRYFAQIISIIPFGLGYFWIAIDQKKQSWHDKLAGTVVIRSRRLEKVVFDK